MAIVSTIPEKCKRCYTCVRECPAKAIRVEHGQAMVVEERCIACGNCVKVCAQNAKSIEDGIAAVRGMLVGGERVFACLAPSFPAAFHPTRPGKLVAAVRRLGFEQVWEVAFGAELISRAYINVFKEAQRAGRKVITTSCPALVAFIEKYIPALHEALAPIVSPMIAVARAIRKRHGPVVRIVFIGPCIAKKNEILDPGVAGAVDAVLTFRELADLFHDAGIHCDRIPESSFDSPRCHVGRSFPISGGLLKTAGLSSDILQNDIVITEGKDRVLQALDELAHARIAGQFFDVLFCDGCISGPKMLNSLSVYTRKEIIADYVAEQSRYTTQKDLAEAEAEFENLDLGRGFTRQNLELRQPTEEEIGEALCIMKKLAPEDQLNCGACGYPNCREKAIAVCQGLAEPAMCLPYLVEELEETCLRLEQSYAELNSAQRRLIEAERLASAGQLSAGVAHEINNPLGTVLLFSHSLLKHLGNDDHRRSDLKMIISEATRCKNIVRGLLDFTRQSRVSKAPTDMAALIEEVLSITTPRAKQVAAHLASDVPDDLPTMMIDATQIRQLLVNLVENAVDAVSPGGTVCVSARFRPSLESVEIEVSDDGCGIPKENLSRLFTPFFTTKEMGKGTGLGLAIAYGVVKMHSGDVTVESEEGKGTTFSVRLPLGYQNEKGNADTNPPETGDSGAGILQEHVGSDGVAVTVSGLRQFPKGERS
ncbi:MAG TPA: [Fe-Fe] hydrogenase large subunit C-terminal domain-containing protein [Thermoguttaceae bacterium]|nr:[Fe-Fe] hydrogenase large subunit C-terminal domain-containing protein [Thermoguttaceae bacterium]